MRKRKLNSLLLIKVYLLLAVILAISTTPLNFTPSLNNKQQTSVRNVREIPHLSQRFEWTENGKVICDAIGDQVLYGMCRSGNESVIVVWTDGRSGNDDIYVQKVASNGTTMWSANGIIICGATGNQEDPQICSDGEGGAIITWDDERNGVESDIYAQRVASNGTTVWTDNGVVICNATSYQWRQQICSGEDGDAIITWEDHRGTPIDIYAQRIASNGTTMWGGNGTVIATSSIDICRQEYPAICTDGAGGAIITWQYDLLGYNIDDIYVQRVALNGTTMWTGNGTVICNATNSQYLSGGICTDGAGGAIITWHDNRNEAQTYAQRIAWNGTIMWAPNGTSMSNLNYYNSPECIWYDGDGSAIITMKEDKLGGLYPKDLSAQKVALNGTTMWGANGTVISNESYTQEKSRICSDGAGGVIIAWFDERSAHDSIYAQRVASDGTIKWAANGMAIRDLSYGNGINPLICYDGKGRAIVMWTDSRSGVSNDIYGQCINIEATPVYENGGSNGGGGNGGGTGTESYILSLEFLILILALFIAGSLISYGVIKKKQRHGSMGRYRGLPATKGKGLIVFVSYSMKDAKKFHIYQIAEKLTSYPEIADVFYYEEGIEDDIIKYRDEHIGKCDIFLLFCSNTSLNSEEIGLEWRAAIGLGKKIIPIFKNERHIPALLASKLGVNFNESDVNGTIDRIYQTIIKKADIPVFIKISRGFEVAGDTFKFFIRIENTLDLALTNVAVKIVLPNTLNLDKKSPAEQITIGNLTPHKFGTAIFYLYCETCADTEINAKIDYIDPKGNLQVEKMAPFPILSCKFVKPRKLSREEFDKEFQSQDKKSVEIKLKEGISDEEAMQMITDRMTMSTVSSSSNSLEMSGKALDGSEIFFKFIIKDIEGVKTAIATVGSSNQHVAMGILSEIIETFMEFRI